jgi:hypothetical protein
LIQWPFRQVYRTLSRWIPPSPLLPNNIISQIFTKTKRSRLPLQVKKERATFPLSWVGFVRGRERDTTRNERNHREHKHCNHLPSFFLQIRKFNVAGKLPSIYA